MQEPSPITSPSLEHDEIYHGFHTRDGGVSEGIYKGLNVGLGSQDEHTNVLENRGRVARHAGVEPGQLVTLYQVHSPNIIAVNAPFEEDKRPQADGLVTNTPGIAIGVLTADCGPVLFSDPESKVVGAAHAGWRGATGGVLENTIGEMENLGAKRQNITAALGPSISRYNYEVGPEFVDRLIDMETTNKKYLRASQNPDHAMFDLPSYIVARLARAGVAASWTGQCTYADDEKFFSYRRTTHNNEPDYGRQISVISIKSC
ncbi:MAG: peptidoglycan editing factor PgeF [Pseudomonadota bacterium]